MYSWNWILGFNENTETPEYPVLMEVATTDLNYKKDLFYWKLKAFSFEEFLCFLNRLTHR